MLRLDSDEEVVGSKNYPWGNWEEIFQSGFPREWLPLTKRDVDKQGNVVAFGPLAQEYSTLEALLLTVVVVKLLKTPEGQKHLVHLFETYLTQSAHVLSSLQKSSASNVFTAIANQFISCKIYARMGLMTSFDALQAEIYLDHMFGEILKSEYVAEMVGGLTTLVDATSYKGETGDYTGLAALAKLMGK